MQTICKKFEMYCGNFTKQYRYTTPYSNMALISLHPSKIQIPLTKVKI